MIIITAVKHSVDNPAAIITSNLVTNITPTSITEQGSTQLKLLHF